jgi:hypothetical protein
VPLAPPRICSRCRRLVYGRCPTCARLLDQARGTAHARGYDRAWLAFRPVFIARLVEAGILPVCGAALPAGPHTADSCCRAAGLLTFSNPDGSSLHLDHDPPLRDDERRDVAAVCDPQRIQLLCAACHSTKTVREAGGGSRNV